MFCILLFLYLYWLPAEPLVGSRGTRLKTANIDIENSVTLFIDCICPG